MNAPQKAQKIDEIQKEVTLMIIEQLKQFETAGTVPKWLQPWDAQGSFSWPLNLTGKPYTGINVMMLLAVQEKLGFPSSVWGTYKAFQDQGVQVLRGSRAARVFFYKSLEIIEKDDHGQVQLDDEGNPITLNIPMLRHYSVFNQAQTDLEPTPIVIPSEDFLGLADLIAKAGVDVRHGYDKAYFDRNGDFICMPNMDRFHTESDYWAALTHEVVHWTGAPHRLNRCKGKNFGDAEYAMEELVAELGSVMLLAQFEIKPVFQSSVYLAHWVAALEADHKLIFRVAAQAQRAVGFVFKSEH